MASYSAAVLARTTPTEDGCLLWDGAVTTNGYGHIRRDGKARLVHRVIFEEEHGPLPDGMEVDHLCFRRLCVNIRHLEAVTHLENVRRAAARITSCRQGHLYDAKNTHITKKGKRHCRACSREQMRRRRLAVV